MEDKDIFIKYSNRPRDAVRCIYEKYRDQMLIIAIALSHDTNIAEDALHDVFIAFAQRLGNFKLTGSLKAYLSICTANRVRDILRRKRHERPDNEQTAAIDTIEPTVNVECNSRLTELSSALAKLPYEQREIIALKIYSQMKFKAIAKSLDIPVNTAKGRYRYGIKKLRSIMNNEVEK